MKICYSPMFCFVLSLFTIVSLCKASLDVENNGDKLILKPVELIDLVIQEQMRKDSPAIRRRFKENIKSSTTDNLEMDVELDAEEEVGDEERLRARKVWSRWGKWSDCSATCGGGSIVRRRLCVAGRCAPGELEEQRRPCALTPCSPPPSVLVPEDVREAEKFI